MKLTALALLLCLTGCGASSHSASNPSLPPVFAGQSYSNAALSGTYSFNLTAFTSSVFTDIGALTLDGNGNITGGQLTIYNYASSCTVSLSGTYSIQSDASGTASLVLTPQSGTCNSGTGFQFKLEAAQAGETVYFTETDGNGFASGSATKQ